MAINGECNILILHYVHHLSNYLHSGANLFENAKYYPLELEHVYQYLMTCHHVIT